MKRILSLLCMLTLFFSASAVSADEVRIATGHTFIKRVFEPVRSAFKEKTGLELKIIYTDPLPALALLEKGDVDVAGASLPIATWLELAKKERFPVSEMGVYSSYEVFKESTRFVVHIANKADNLSREQLKGIFTGTINNWKDVGGSDLPILVVLPTLTSGAFITVKQKVMDNEPFVKTLFDVEALRDVPDAVASAPEAIGIVTGKITGNGIKEVAPQIERPMTLITKGKASPNIQKLLDFLKGEGKQYIQ